MGSSDGWTSGGQSSTIAKRSDLLLASRAPPYRVPAHACGFREVAAQWLTEANEVQARRFGMGGCAVHHGMPVGGEDPKVPDHWLEVSVIGW